MTAFAWGVAAGIWISAAIASATAWWYWHRTPAGPPHETITVPVGFTKGLAERNPDQITYVKLSGRWLVSVDDLARALTVAADEARQQHRPAPASAYLSVAQHITSTTLAEDIDHIGGES